jgi:hypothetical protein
LLAGVFEAAAMFALLSMTSSASTASSDFGDLWRISLLFWQKLSSRGLPRGGIESAKSEVCCGDAEDGMGIAVTTLKMTRWGDFILAVATHV